MLDPEADLAPIARRLEAHADGVRRSARELAALTATTRWDSPAGRLARAAADDLIGHLLDCAVRLDDCAGQLRAHARRAAQVRRALADPVSRGLHTVEAVVR